MRSDVKFVLGEMAIQDEEAAKAIAAAEVMATDNKNTPKKVRRIILIALNRSYLRYCSSCNDIFRPKVKEFEEQKLNLSPKNGILAPTLKNLRRRRRGVEAILVVRLVEGSLLGPEMV